MRKDRKWKIATTRIRTKPVSKASRPATSKPASRVSRSAGRQQTGSRPEAPFGRASGGDTTLAQGQTDQLDKRTNSAHDESGKRQGLRRHSKEEDTSEAYLSEGETGETDFAETGQGATEARTGAEQ